MGILDVPAKPAIGRGNTIMALGDSITSNGWDTAANHFAWSPTGQAYLAWVTLLSKGRLTLYAPNGVPCTSAAAGRTSAQILSTYLPAILTAKPAYCIVIAGRNDSNLSIADHQATIANLTSIYQQLMAAGIVPVCCTMPPINDPGAFGDDATNHFISRFAQVNGLPFADLVAPMVDPAGTGYYLNHTSPSTYNVDNIHPNELGGKTIGTAIWNALQNYVPPATRLLVGHNAAAGSDTAQVFRSTGNMLMVNATSGLPTGWSNDFGSGNGETVDITTASAVVGKLVTITRGTADYGIRLGGQPSAITGGHKVFFGFECQSSVVGVGGNAEVTMSNFDGSVSNFAGFTAWGQDIPAGSVFQCEFTWPTGLTNNVPWPRIRIRGAAGAKVSAGRFTLVDLTAQGIA